MKDIAATITGFAEKFTTKELVTINGSFDTLSTKELCAQKSDGTSVCVTGDELSAILSDSVLGTHTENAAGTQSLGGGGATGGSSAPGGENGADSTSTTTSSEIVPITSAASSTPEVAEPAPASDPEAANDNPQPQEAEQSSHDGNGIVEPLPAEAI